MMPPMFGQPWRQAMMAPQASSMPTGSMFPTRGPGGGWMMPGPPPFDPKPLQQTPPPPPAAPPMFGQGNFMSHPVFGPGGDFAGPSGFTPGADAMGSWGGMFGGAMGNGWGGWGGMLGLGADVGAVGQDSGSGGGGYW